MEIAGSVDCLTVLASLARRRPVFHSEADLQHELAWEVHTADPAMQVRLETRPRKGVRLDLLFARPDLQQTTAFEVKYLTAAFTADIAAERFELPNHGAQDVRGYDAVLDIARVESFVRDKSGWNGLALVLTNDPSYWRAPSHSRPTNADAFRLYEGLTIAGSRAWGPNTGAGTMKNRLEAIQLAGSYVLEWRDFSRLPGARGEFRYLLVAI